MLYAIRNIRFFILTVLCLNSVMMVASEYNRIYYPVPHLPGASTGITYKYPNFSGIFPNEKKQIMMIATIIIIVSIVYYIYKQDCLKRAKNEVLKEMNSYIAALKQKMDHCIDTIPMPAIMRKYLKESISQSIAEHVANAHNSTKRYIQKNKKYFISLTAAPTGMFLGYPVTGGAVAMLGIVYGAIQSAREEIAEFRKETEQLFAQTNKNITDGFQKVESDAESNKQEILGAVDELSGKVQEVTSQIQQLRSDVGNKVDCVGEKVDNLSVELQKVTEQMIRLHSDRDKKDDELVTKLEDASNQLAGAKEEFVGLVEKMMQESTNITKEKFDAINKQLLQIHTTGSEQAATLIDVQKKIGILLDQHEADDKQFIQLLDSIRSSNLSLEEMKGNIQNQEKKLINVCSILDEVQNKIQKNREDLLGAVAQSVEQCSDLSNRVQQLEKRVGNNHVYTVTTFEQIVQQNNGLKKKIELMQQEAVERETRLLQVINDLKNDHKKENLALRQEFIKAHKDLQSGQSQILSAIENGQKDNEVLGYSLQSNLLEARLKQHLCLIDNSHHS